MKKPLLHRHEWRRRPQGDIKAGWHYQCTVCGMLSRNAFYQDKAFQQPAVMRSIYMDFTGPTPHFEVLPPMIVGGTA